MTGTRSPTRRSSGSGTRSVPTCRSWTPSWRRTGEPRLTYFECLTILGFAVFADQPVNVAVIEVGLGGITDATNVGDGQVSVITPISLDHTDLLGDTTEDIAYEKAGIIKPGGFLVSAAQPVDAAQVLLEKAKERGGAVPLRRRGVRRRIPHRGRGRPDGHHPGHRRALPGPAGSAARRPPGAERGRGRGRPGSVLRRAKRNSTFEVLQEGFAAVTSPGRLEVVRTAPTIIVDAAHNPDGIKASAEALQEAFTFTRLVPVVGVLKEKDAEEILRQLKESLGDMAEEYCFTQSNSPARRAGRRTGRARH